MGDWPFRELVGCLMWLVNQTGPDIAERAVARYVNKPGEVHWSTAIGIQVQNMCFVRVLSV